MTSSHEEFVVILTTAGSEEEAAKIAKALVDQRLAACVSVGSPIRSTYRWKGDVLVEEERMLFVKTLRARFDAVSSAIRALHSYENPEIVLLPIEAGSEPYLQWIRDCAGEDR